MGSTYYTLALGGGENKEKTRATNKNRWCAYPPVCVDLTNRSAVRTCGCVLYCGVGAAMRM